MSPFRSAAFGFGALLLLLLPSASLAQSVGGRPDMSRNDAFGDLLQEYASPDWKEPTWTLRPKEKDPARQLEYSRKLEAEGKASAARAEYDALVHEWQSSPEAPEAQLALARLYDADDKKARAFKEYQYAILMFPNAIPYEEIVLRQMALLRAMEGELGTGFLGMGETMDATEIARLYQVVAANAPANSAIAPECFFRMGELYSGKHCGKYDLSLEPYETVVVRYPASAWAPVAAYRAARARVLLARKYPRDEKRTRSALQSVDTVLQFYAPRMANGEAVRQELLLWKAEMAEKLSHAEYQKAEFYDTIRHKPTAAIAAYRRFLELHPESADAPRARARLQTLASEVRE